MNVWRPASGPLLVVVLAVAALQDSLNGRARLAVTVAGCVVVLGG